ncbi:unnamed protein product [Rhizoctonia solani]|uniref:Fungal-type protein kinase domain-containing protein n=1 Tax=Rhizoctonia solani TaxID=456999 RepID=A0A8H3HKK9_9AGAM|nr:unnamed protein product [Rhizoctonia solani]
MADIPTSPQRSYHPLPYNSTSSTPPRSHGQAPSSTPLRVSSAHSVGGATANSNPSYVDSSRRSVHATPAPATQIQMDRYIESELHKSIFHDPMFIKRFLSGDLEKLDQVHEECKDRNGYYRETGKWELPTKINAEKVLYQPVLDILNTIKEAVDAVDPPTNMYPSPSTSHNHGPSSADKPSSNHDRSGDYVPEQPKLPRFFDTSTYTVGSDRAETKLIKPDLMLFGGNHKLHKHWEHVRMPIEIKRLGGHQKVAMKQLSRYARAVFAHQLHRRHLYAMMVCGTEATFVRFDRAGILYSRRIDLRTESKAFTYAFASLLMLDEADQGYDPAFTYEMNKHGRLDYCVDLPASAFANQEPEPTAKPTTSRENDTLRFKVVIILCHRRSICGRATIVLRIRRVEGDANEYILKIMWRDPERSSEGEVLRKVKGKFGLAQYVWHGDALGKCRCSPKATLRCAKCVAETVQIDEPEVCDKLMDIAIEVPPEDEESEKDVELRVVDTTVCRPTSRRRPRRICTLLIISSNGAPLQQAGSPRQFMEAVLDAILGYWGLFNIGILHRDISEGNVLMLHPGQHLDRSNGLTDIEITDEILIESEKKLREVLKNLDGREPTGMLSDLDLHSNHSVVPSGPTVVDSFDTNLTIPRETDPLVTSSLVSSSSRASGSTRRSREDTTEDTRGPKKRKTSSHTGDVPATAQSGPVSRPASSRGDRGNRLIDFRTGTLAFMSIRVVDVPIGERYHHTFLDDIESFFWLILWSAAAHLDPDVHRPTDAAQAMLNLLNQHDPYGMKTLERFHNSWASHRLFSDVILKFGALAHRYYYGAHQQVFSPLDVFPEVVRVFQDALSRDSD